MPYAYVNRQTARADNKAESLSLFLSSVKIIATGAKTFTSPSCKMQQIIIADTFSKSSYESQDIL